MRVGWKSGPKVRRVWLKNLWACLMKCVCTVAPLQCWKMALWKICCRWSVQGRLQIWRRTCCAFARYGGCTVSVLSETRWMPCANLRWFWRMIRPGWLLWSLLLPLMFWWWPVLRTWIRCGLRCCGLWVSGLLAAGSIFLKRGCLWLVFSPTPGAVPPRKTDWILWRPRVWWPAW